MVPNVAPPTTFATSGFGTGLLVTDGTPPSGAETEALLADIQRTLPRGDAAAPPPKAFIQGIGRVACPKDMANMDLPTARIWLHQPEIAPAPNPPGNGAPRRGN
jgi:hypothetical protein